MQSKLTYDVCCGVDPESESIHLAVKRAEEMVSYEIIRTKDKAVREALIELGWTPPEEAQKRP